MIDLRDPNYASLYQGLGIIVSESKKGLRKRKKELIEVRNVRIGILLEKIFGTNYLSDSDACNLDNIRQLCISEVIWNGLGYSEAIRRAEEGLKQLPLPEVVKR